MPSDIFFDTNLIVYFSFDDDAKAEQADELLRAGGVVSIQVLNEFANVARRKRKRTYAEINIALDAIKSTCLIVPLTIETHRLGMEYAERYQLALYDAMIVAAAVLAGCTRLYSEDLHDGLIIDGLTIRNPFVVS
jgi:predicted nucleic acid-binding protein